MLDHRVYTFLSLCETRSYTRTAEALKMTQPGVTQHVQYLERGYGCRLFEYENRRLELTAEGRALEAQLRSAVAADTSLRQELSSPGRRPLRLGATKTIGEFVVGDTVRALAQEGAYQLRLEVENTHVLLQQLREFQLDVALVEGRFDKGEFAHRSLRKEKLVGVCAKGHRFAGRAVSLEELLGEHILLREEGSGTRDIFEAMLAENHYTVEAFDQRSEISSLAVICQLVEAEVGVSLVYETVAANREHLVTFTVKGEPMRGEFNLVYLPQYEARPWFVEAFLAAWKNQL